MTGPETYHEASDGNIVDQIDRYRELADQRRHGPVDRHAEGPRRRTSRTSTSTRTRSSRR